MSYMVGKGIDCRGQIVLFPDTLETVSHVRKQEGRLPLAFRTVPDYN